MDGERNENKRSRAAKTKNGFVKGQRRDVTFTEIKDETGMRKESLGNTPLEDTRGGALWGKHFTEREKGNIVCALVC